MDEPRYKMFPLPDDITPPWGAVCDAEIAYGPLECSWLSSQKDGEKFRFSFRRDDAPGGGLIIDLSPADAQKIAAYIVPRL